MQPLGDSGSFSATAPQPALGTRGTAAATVVPMDDAQLNAQRVERDALEAQLLALEKIMEKSRQLCLAAAEEQAQQDRAHLAASPEV